MYHGGNRAYESMPSLMHSASQIGPQVVLEGAESTAQSLRPGGFVRGTFWSKKTTDIQNRLTVRAKGTHLIA